MPTTIDSQKKLSCFVISPIGEEGTKTRERANTVLDYIIKPAAADCGFLAVRADEIDKPGLISTQVVKRVIDDDLVIADLTEMNPNVFYELAIRHCARKPLIQIIEKGERIPFDVAGLKTIIVDHTSLPSAGKAKDEITRQIRELLATDEEVDTPVSVGLQLMALQKSDRPEDRNFADLLEEIVSLKSEITSGFISEDGERNMNFIDAESRMRLRSIDVQMLRILEELSAGREELLLSLRENLRNPTLMSEDSRNALRSRHEKVKTRSISTLDIEKASLDIINLIGILATEFRDVAPWIYEIGIGIVNETIAGGVEKPDREKVIKFLTISHDFLIGFKEAMDREHHEKKTRISLIISKLKDFL